MTHLILCPRCVQPTIAVADDRLSQMTNSVVCGFRCTTCGEWQQRFEAAKAEPKEEAVAVKVKDVTLFDELDREEG